jgi:pimeloyl-ACP methyl ester carboxylesterase
VEIHLGRVPAQVEQPEPLKFASPLVVLPELFTTRRHLATVIGYFATIGWQVYAPDLRAAAGKGPTPALERLGFGDMVELAAEALGAIGREAVVVGHGAGGLIALKLAERPEVKAAVALAPLVPGFPTSLFMRAGNLGAILRGRALKPPAGRALLSFVADADPFQRAEAARTMIRDATRTALDVARGRISFERAGAAPRLIVAGDRDVFAPFEKVHAFASALNAPIARIAGRGHWLIGGRALERAVDEAQRFLVRALGRELLLLYSEQPDED